MSEIWERVSDRLRRDIGENWIEGTRLISIDGDKAVVEMPSRFKRDWVANTYSDIFLRQLSSAEPNIRRVEFTARKGARRSDDTGRKTGRSAAGYRNRASMGGKQLGVNLDPRFTFESFVIGRPNTVAHAAAWRMAQEDSLDFNPLFLHGNVGLGKTHLMHAIGWALVENNPDAKVLYLSAETFMYRFVQALSGKTMMEFKDQFRSVDALMVDDVQFIADKNSTQEEFFHTFNALIDQGKKIIISGDRSPGAIEGIGERILSRLQAGLVVDLHPTDYELRLSILMQKSHAHKQKYPALVFEDGLFEFMSRRISSNVRVLEGALNRLVSTAQMLQQSEITLNFAKETLLDIIKETDRKIEVDTIIRHVAEHYSIPKSDLVGPKRQRPVVRARQAAIYLSKQLTDEPLVEIGRKFGDRDHTTVIHSVRMIEKLKAQQSRISEDLEILRRRIEE